MPFTPFHFGPGAALKAAMPRHFSFTVFCFAQVITDAEVAYYLIRGEYPLHRWFHTYVGATALAVFAIVAGRPPCQLILRVWMAWKQAPFQRFYPATWRIRPTSAITAALIGTYSHVLLDSFVHADMKPWSEDNPLLRPAFSSLLHALCIVLGIVGAAYVATSSPK
jgi:hypothetical protein